MGLLQRTHRFESTDQDHFLWGLEPIYRNGEMVGYLRRTSYSYCFDKHIGYGYLESLNGEKYGLEFDWYSYGVTLFELLTRCALVPSFFLPAVAPPKTRT